MAVVITIGSNSWITQAEADVYLEEKWGAADWAGLTAIQKAQLIITAYRWINQQNNLSIPAASGAQVVKNAQIEAAWFIYNYWTEFDKRRALHASGVRQFDVSEFSENLDTVKFPDFILNLLFDFLVNDGGCFPRMERDLYE